MSDFEVNHPLVATPKVIADPSPLPSEVGRAPPTGRVGANTLDTMMAVAEALFSDDDGPPPADRLAFLRREYADFMARASARGRFYFTAGALVISVVAPLLVLRIGPFRRLPLSLRVKALERFEARPIGTVLIALRAVLCLIYYEHPDSALELGLEVGPQGRFS